MTLPQSHQSNIVTASSSRRGFIKTAGLASAAALLLSSGCDTTGPENQLGEGVILDLRNDVGALNYILAVEEVKASFYQHSLEEPADGFSSEESRIFRDIRTHEMIHRDALRAILGSSAVAALRTNFSDINFGSREEVLSTARKFENTSVGAYNSVGKLVDHPSYLTLLGKIVSVEARHAAVLHEISGEDAQAFAQLTTDELLAAGSDPDRGLGVLAGSLEQAFSTFGQYVETPIRLMNSQ